MLSKTIVHNGMTESECWDFIRSRMSACLADIAPVFVALEEAGCDCSRIAPALRSTLRAIHSGKLVPEIAEAIGVRSPVLAHIQKMTPERQAEIAKNGVEVADGVVGGVVQTRRVPLNILEISIARIIFRDGELLSPEEQIVAMNQARIAKSLKPPKTGLRLDKSTKSIMVGRSRVSLRDIQSMISEMIDSPEVELTVDELQWCANVHSLAKPRLKKLV